MDKKEFIPKELPLDIELNAENYQLLISASRELGKLNGFINTIPNQNILINSLVLQEAKDSSAVENIITTHDELFLAQVDENSITQSAKEVIGYEAALKKGFDLIKKDNLILNKHILAIQKRMQNNNAGFRTQSGTVLKNPATGEVKHIPPQNLYDIQRLMSNLEKYINEDLDDFDPLIRLAIIHYQFETIHPFFDVNGRTGRIINVLYLTYKGLLDLPILYLSAYIIQNKTQYYRLLENVSKNNSWNEWISYILTAVQKTSIATIKIISQINEAMQTFSVKLQATNSKIYSKDFVELVFSYPYTKIEFISQKLGIARQTASKYLKICEDIGLLECLKLGNTNFYINISLFNILKKGIEC